MKIIKTETYRELLNKIEHFEKSRDYYYERAFKAESIESKLEKELEEAKNLKEILEKMSSMTINGQGFAVSGGAWSIASEFNLPDDVLRYVDDILGGKVIKQEGTKCLVIDKDGNVKTGLTKQKSDKGYSYKLVRE